MSRFRFIYAWGMFRPQAMPRLPLELFQFIYVRGMFPSASGIGRWSTRWFQLIYVRGECFNTGRGHQPMGISFNSYMCGEYFWRLVDVISNVKCVSTHICAGNVSKQELAFDRNLKVSTHICAGNVSTRRGLLHLFNARFDSYMRGECFCYGLKFYRAVLMFRFIYVRGMFWFGVRVMGCARGFNSYMCGERFFRTRHRIYRDSVSTHICAGNVFLWTWGYDWFGRLGFQLIYVRGMFPSRARSKMLWT